MAVPGPPRCRQELVRLADISSESIVAERGRVSTFAALRFPNFRLWFFGQTVSLMGTWMQSVAQSWVVYALTGSAFALGAVTFAGTVPTLFLMLVGGAVADRVPKRSLLLVTQSVMMVLAFTLAILAAVPGALQVWQIIVMAVLLGIANSFDAPARQAMAVEMVDDRRYFMNAIALNSTIFNMARVVGPALGGIVLALAGAAWCFGLNALSFVAVIIALLLMRFPATTTHVRRLALGPEIAEGLSYVWSNVSVRAIIGIVTVSSVFAFSYAVLLPAYAVDVLHVGEAGLGGLNAAVGGGALIGSLVVASVGQSAPKGWLLTAGGICFPVALLVVAASKSLPLSLAGLVLVGLGAVVQNATANTLVQTIVPDELRGRVMGVYTLTFFGTTPFGALLAGSLAQALGVAAAVAILASATLVIVAAILVATPALRRIDI
jgi:MFS family permease